MKNKLHNQRGNVLIYILIAIALLAALSYAVSKGSRNSGSALTSEQARIAAQEIIDYGNDIAIAVQKLTLRGCGDAEISFENALVAGYSNINSPTDESCHVFSENGGRINVQEFPDSFYDSTKISGFLEFLTFNGNNDVVGVGTTEADLILFNSALNEDICTNINNILHGEKILYQDSNGLSAGVGRFSGSYASGSTKVCEAGSMGEKLSGCCHELVGCSATDCMHFFQVLIAR